MRARRLAALAAFLALSHLGRPAHAVGRAHEPLVRRAHLPRHVLCVVGRRRGFCRGRFFSVQRTTFLVSRGRQTPRKVDREARARARRRHMSKEHNLHRYTHQLHHLGPRRAEAHGVCVSVARGSLENCFFERARQKRGPAEGRGVQILGRACLSVCALCFDARLSRRFGETSDKPGGAAGEEEAVSSSPSASAASVRASVPPALRGTGGHLPPHISRALSLPGHLTSPASPVSLQHSRPYTTTPPSIFITHARAQRERAIPPQKPHTPKIALSDAPSTHRLAVAFGQKDTEPPRVQPSS